jgi:hypothetical protein
MGAGRARLSRGHLDGSERGALLLRVEVTGEGGETVEDQVIDLMTDLRLLGLRPTRLAEQVA